MPEQDGALRNRKGSQRHRNAADQHEVEHIRADHVAERKVAVALDQGGDGGDELRKARAEGNKGQCNHRFRHAKRLSNLGAVFHKQVCPQGDQRRAQDQEQNHFPDGQFLAFRLLRLRLRRVFHLPDIQNHIDKEHAQHQNADCPGKTPDQVSSNTIDGCGEEKEQNGHFQGFRVHLSGADGDGDGGDQGCIADYRADGVSVGDFPVAGDGGHRGNHDFRQRGADGHDRCADQQLRQMEASGKVACAVHKPVSAFNEAGKTDKKQ